MWVPRQRLASYLAATAGVALLAAGWTLNNLPCLGAGVAAICLVGVSEAFQALRRARRVETKTAPAPTPRPRRPVDASDSDGLVCEMLDQGRYSLLLRPQLAANLEDQHRSLAREALVEQMALVPDGDVLLERPREASDDDEQAFDQETAGVLVQVDAYYLDRCAVSNRQYLEFVIAGGYEQMALWDKKILPALLDFVDQSGCPGPRFWKHGRYPSGEDDHPVVGVSWYEAAAYAAWVGKRLPTDAEWVKAGCWPVVLSPESRMQRRFPWGETMDRQRANVWGSGPGRTVEVNKFTGGVSVGGANQLIGNTWEWTSSGFGQSAYSRRDLVLSSPMKSIRGGAFDTYYENQATCQFQSGENPVARKHNIGFRCAVGMCDVAGALDERGVFQPRPELLEQPFDAACEGREAVA